MREVKPLLTASEAAEYLGYKSARRFRAAVSRGVMPEPLDAMAKPQLWSLHQLNKALEGTLKGSVGRERDPIMERINSLDWDRARR